MLGQEREKGGNHLGQGLGHVVVDGDYAHAEREGGRGAGRGDDAGAMMVLLLHGRSRGCEHEKGVGGSSSMYVRSMRDEASAAGGGCCVRRWR